MKHVLKRRHRTLLAVAALTAAVTPAQALQIQIAGLPRIVDGGIGDLDGAVDGQIRFGPTNPDSGWKTTGGLLKEVFGANSFSLTLTGADDQNPFVITQTGNVSVNPVIDFGEFGLTLPQKVQDKASLDGVVNSPRKLQNGVILTGYTDGSAGIGSNGSFGVVNPANNTGPGAFAGAIGPVADSHVTSVRGRLSFSFGAINPGDTINVVFSNSATVGVESPAPSSLLVFGLGGLSLLTAMKHRRTKTR